MKELIEPFYRPSVAERALARLSLHSESSIALIEQAGRQYMYVDPIRPDMNANQDIFRYERAHLEPLKGRSFPLVADFNAVQSREQNPRIRLMFRLALSPEEADHLGAFREFDEVRATNTIKVTADILPHERIPNDDMAHIAASSIRKVMQLNHPARMSMPLARRTVDPVQYK
jgi:hypothetical protein